MLLACTVPVFALDDDEYSGYSADTLEIDVGYFGGPYYQKHTFTLSELWKMDVVNQDYTFIDNMPSVVIDHVSGVRLSDLMEAAGIDLNSIETFYFWTRDKQSDYYTSYTKAQLIDTPRYCYYSLPDNFDSDAGKGNEMATSDGVPVDTVIALADNWTRCIAGATFGSDYQNLNTNTRFRLIFGQTNSYERTASRSAKWIHKIVVALGGAPTVTLSDTSLEGKVGSVLRTEATVNADSAVKANQKVTWSSSDDKIASVDQNGNITVNGDGTAVVTATFGGVSASVTVNGKDDDSQKAGAAAAGTGSSGSQGGSGSGTAGSTGGSGSQSKSGSSASSSSRLTASSVPGREISINQPATITDSSKGGVQNWRAYEMSEGAQALPDLETDNPLLRVSGMIGAGLFVSGGVGFTVLFRVQTGKGKFRSPFRRLTAAHHA